MYVTWPSCKLYFMAHTFKMNYSYYLAKTITVLLPQRKIATTVATV